MPAPVGRWLLAGLMAAMAAMAASAATAATAPEAVLLDADGRPFIGANVVFDSGQNAHTDAEGHIALPDGVSPQTAWLTLHEHHADGYYVLRGPWDAVLRPYRVPYEPLTGQVVRSDGAAVSGARVRAGAVQWGPDQTYVPPPPTMAGWEAITGANGEFTLLALPRGSDVAVAVDAPGRLASGRFQISPTRARCRLAPEGGGILTGRLLEPDGKPAFAARILARVPGTTRSFGATTAADGRFALDVRTDGTYQLVLDGSVWWVESPAGAGPLELHGAERQDFGEIRLRPMVPLAVRVRGGDAETVVVWRPDGEPSRWTVAPIKRNLGADGRARLMVPPGPAKVSVGDRATAVVVPPAGLEQPVELDLSPADPQPAPMRVRVVDRSGADVASAQISLGSFEQPQPVKRSANGEFVVALADSRHPVTINLGCAESALVATRVVPAAPGQVVRLLLDVPGYAVVRGRIVDTAGQPVAGAAVMLRWIWPFNDFTRNESRDVVTGDDGRFEFAAVGTWLQVRLSVRHGLDEAFGDTWLPPSNGDAVTGVRDFVDVRVGPRRASLSGTVVDPSGQPVAGATVVALAGSGSPGLGPRTLSDAAGGFTLTGLAPRATRILAMSGRDRHAEQLAVPGRPALLVLQPYVWRLPELRQTALGIADDVWRSSSTSLRASVIPWMARLDPATCLSWLDTLPAHERERYIGPIFEAVAQRQPALLRGRLAELQGIGSDDRRLLATARVAAFVAADDPAVAAQIAQDLSRVELASPLAAPFEASRARLAAMLKQPEAATWAAAAGRAVAAYDGELRNVGLHRVAPLLAEWPELLDRLVAELHDSRMADVAHAAVLPRLAALNPSAAVRCYDAWFPSTSDAARASGDLASAVRDVPAITLVERDLTAAAGALATTDPLHAAVWAQALLGGNARRTAMNQVALAQHDPAARARGLAEVAARYWPEDSLVLAAHRAAVAAQVPDVVAPLLHDSLLLGTGRFSMGLALAQPNAARLALERELGASRWSVPLTRGQAEFAPDRLRTWVVDATDFPAYGLSRLVLALVPEAEQLEAEETGQRPPPWLDCGETWSYTY